VGGSMPLEDILPLAIGAWGVMLLLVLSLCRAAKQNDDAMDAAVANAIAADSGAEIVRLSSPERSLRSLSVDDAADLLGVSPHTLRVWEEHYGFPTSSPSEARYNQSEVLALRDSLEDGVSITSAVIHARAHNRRRRSAAAAHVLGHLDGGLAS
ncbi:MAG: MerR family transcriptional regulator, partial [Candidatus Sulfotelmatobacter sp.]